MIKYFSIEGRYGDLNKNYSAQRLKTTLENHGLIYDDKNPDVIICLGGDGSLLKSLHYHDFEGKYILLNGGTLGFLSDFLMSEMDKLAYSILNIQPVEEVYKPLVIQDCMTGKYAFAANEFSLVSPIKAINYTMYINGDKLSDVQSSGLLISSTFGSTAYNLSCGGPVLLTNDNSYIINILAPLNNRATQTNFKTLVVSENAKVAINIEQNFKTYRIAADGIELTGFTSHDLEFYQSLKKQYSILHYKLKSKVRRIGYSFGKN